MVSDEARDLARRTKAELQRRGRHRGDYYWLNSAKFDPSDADTCKVCVVGAAVAAAGGNVLHSTSFVWAAPAVFEELIGAMADRTGGRRLVVNDVGELVPLLNEDVEVVAAWHDNLDTSDDDVYRVLDSIANDQ